MSLFDEIRAESPEWRERWRGVLYAVGHRRRGNAYDAKARSSARLMVRALDLIAAEGEAARARVEKIETKLERVYHSRPAHERDRVKGL